MRMIADNGQHREEWDELEEAHLKHRQIVSKVAYDLGDR